MNGRLVPSTSPCRRPTSTFTVRALGLKARRTARDRNLRHGQCSGAGASFCLHSGRKWRGRGRRCAVKSGDLPRCCSTCRRSIRSIWPSYRKWTAQVRECGVLAAGTVPGTARHSRPADFRCSGGRVRKNRCGVPQTGI